MVLVLNSEAPAPEGGEDLVVLRPGRNLGVAGALNLAGRVARERGATHLWWFDQDSHPAPGARLQLQEVLADDPCVAAVGPTLVDAARNTRLPQPGDGALVPVDVLVTSGTLVTVEHLDAVGDLDEELFLDHVDSDWCLRARAAGLQLRRLEACRMTHSVGEHTLRYWLGRWRYVPVHHGVRRYYQVRNSLLLYRRGHCPGGWAAKDLVRQALAAGADLLLGGSPVACLGWMLAGLRDGVRGRGGPWLR